MLNPTIEKLVTTSFNCVLESRYVYLWYHCYRKIILKRSCVRSETKSLCTCIQSSAFIPQFNVHRCRHAVFKTKSSFFNLFFVVVLSVCSVIQKMSSCMISRLPSKLAQFYHRAIFTVFILSF